MYTPTTKQHRFQIFAVLFCCLALAQFSALPASASEDDNITFLDRSAKAFSAVVKQAGPAVVHIRVEKSVSRGNGQNPFEFFNDPFFERFFGPQYRNSPHGGKQRDFKQSAAGSGFIISSDGLILTNNHMVGESDSIMVRLADEREFKAEVIGTDPQSDVALIKIEGKDLPFLPMGDSDRLEVGEWVIAIGSPFELNQTVTVGVVSAKGRSKVGISDYENFIQTDAAINPGNSGGPLLNIHGEVIGMNTAIFSRSGGYMGIGFAIPINMARVIQEQLLKHGKVTRGWLGVAIQDVTEDLAKSFSLDNKRGVLVSEVTMDSPAEEAGLVQGDVITDLNGIEINDTATLRNKVALILPGTKVPVKLIRDGKKKTVTVTIGEQPENFGKAGVKGDATLKNLGLALQDLTPDLARQFNYEENQGVLVADVEPGSPAAKAGMKAGQLIEGVNRKRIRTLEELQQVLKESTGTDQVLLRVRSGEYSQYVFLRAEK